MIFGNFIARFNTIILLLKEGNEEARRIRVELEDLKTMVRKIVEAPPQIESSPKSSQPISTAPKSWGRLRRELEIADFERAVRERESHAPEKR